MWRCVVWCCFDFIFLDPNHPIKLRNCTSLISFLSIALPALKSLYISHLISATSVAFRKIAQAAGGVQGQGELVPWCHKFSSVFLSCFDHILITVCFCLSLMVSCFNVLCHVVVSH
jgi:hypothetical protein